jgi:membrane fusion protein, multidrug efflux system
MPKIQQQQQKSQAPLKFITYTVATRPIKVAQISEGQALIDSGLQANEQVVVDGQYKLQPDVQPS